MARSNGSKARRGPRRGSGGRGGRRVVLAGRGKGWELWVPEDEWQRMTEAERAAAVERQRALMEPARASTVKTSAERRPRRGPGTVAGALDQPAGAVQLALFGG